MVKQDTLKGRPIWSCEVCGFGYAQRKTAEACEAYCKTHAGCSMEIIKKAVKRP
jgi:rubredoxin